MTARPWALGAALGGLAATLAHGAFYRNSPLFGRVTARGRSHGRDLYLTFDDGPGPLATERVLEALAARGVQAGFFMTGDHVRRFPEIARGVASEGHVIGNHTDRHARLHSAGPGRTRREIESAHAAIERGTGVVPRAFRAPHGFRNPFVAGVAERLGYTVFGWTFGVWDTERPGVEEIRRRVRERLCPGAVILLHDGDGREPAGDRRQTAQALPGILSDAFDAGYAFRPLSDLFPS